MMCMGYSKQQEFLIKMGVDNLISHHPRTVLLSYNRGQVQLDLSNYVYLVKEGVVLLSRNGIILRPKSIGSIIFSMPLSEKQKGHEYFAPGDLSVYAIPNEDFWRICTQKTDLENSILSNLENDLKEVSFRLRLLKRPKKYKLVLWLIQHEKQLEEFLGNDHLSFLTDYLSIGKSKLLGYLYRLECRGLIKMTGNKIVIIDPKGLRMSLKFGLN